MAKKQQEPTRRRQRRSVEQRIADLEAKLVLIKDRMARKQAKADPALRHAAAALRSIDKALAATKNAGTKEALNEARSSLSRCLAPKGVVNAASRGIVRRSAGEIADLGDALLNYVRNNPGQRGEQIAAAMAMDAATIRPVMKRLIAAGKIRTKGQKRGMTYSAV